MMIPDHTIVRKIRDYDPYLFVQWNNRKQYFEIWRRMAHGRRLITPVTQSIFNPKAPIAFTPLDERILAWLYYGDSARWGNKRQFLLEQDKRFINVFKAKRIMFQKMFRDMAKDAYKATTNFFATKHVSKDEHRPFRKPKIIRGFLRPDVQAGRILKRSRANALAYRFKAR